MTVRLLLCAFVGFAFTGCGAANDRSLNGRIPMDCTRPASPQLLYPINGATGVPDGNFTMVLAFTVAPSIWGSPSVTTPNGGASSGAIVGPMQPAPSPLPAPIATPPSGSTLEGVNVGPLLSGKTYTVWFYYVPPAECVAPGAGTLPITVIGTFTTQ